MEIPLIFLLPILGVLTVWNAILTFLLYSTRKKNEQFFEFGTDNVRCTLTTIIDQNKSNKQRSEKIEKDLERIGDIIKSSIQKFGFIRYNPFKDTGGDQSFSMALLDLENNGVVITSIHGREVDRIYAKPVEKGISKNNLSAEETEALRKAIK